MNKRQEEIIVEMSKLAEELSEYIAEWTFWVANWHFDVHFFCKYSDFIDEIEKT